jgi:hypothetical protein
MFGIELPTLLGLTVVGAIVSTFGSLAGVLLKDYFFTRSFETWKQERALEQLYQKFRDPLRLAARELASRVAEILDHYPPIYLRQEVIESHPDRQIKNNIHDPYFQRYKLVSTAYRFCAFFGWLELYRQEITFLHLTGNKHTRAFEQAINLIRSDLADGQLNKATDWPQWRDTLIFREELRAIGESMIEMRGTTRTILGYGRFCEMIENEAPSAAKRWCTAVVFNFFLGLERGQDFRKTRLQRLVVHLVDVLELLDGPIDEEHLQEARVKWRASLGDAST